MAQADDDFDSFMKGVGSGQGGDPEFDQFMKGVGGAGVASPATQATAPAAPAPSLTSRVASDLGRMGYAAEQGAVRGAAGLMGIPGLAERAGRMLRFPARTDLPPSLPTPSDVAGALTEKGLLDEKFTPRTLPESIANALGGAAASLPIGAGMNMPLAENVAYSAIPAVVGAVGEQAGVPSSLSAPLTALGMTGLQKVATDQMAKVGAAKGLAKAEGDVEAFKLGRAGELSKTADSINAARDARIAAANNDIEGIAGSIGQSRTVGEAAKKLQDVARNWDQNVFPVKVKAAEDALHAVVPEDTLGDLSNFEGALKNSYWSAGKLDSLASAFRSRLPERVAGQLERLIGEHYGPDAVLTGNAGPLPAVMRDMRALRSTVGYYKSRPELAEGVDPNKLDELYRALSSDLEGTAAKVPGGAQAWQKFNAITAPLYSMEEGPVSDIISTVNKQKERIYPEEALANTVARASKGGSRLEMLRADPDLAKGLDEVAAAYLREPGQKSWSTLSPEAKLAMVPDAGFQSRIERAISARDEAAADAKDAIKSAKEGAKQTGVELGQKLLSAKGENARMNADSTLRNLSRKLEWAGEGALGYLKAAPIFNEAASHLVPGGQLSHVGDVLGPAAVWSGVEGAKAIARNPVSIRNALQGYVATAPWGRRGNGLGGAAPTQ